MPFDRFLIAPFNTGLQQDLRPWQILDDAFTQLNNAYVFRGRVRKRFGSALMGAPGAIPLASQFNSRLRMSVGTTNSSGALSVTVPGSIFKVGQAFSVDNVMLTVSVLGTPGVLLSTDPAVSGTYNTTTGALVIASTSAHGTKPVYFYPAEPVMGFTNYQMGAINNQPTYAFDTQFAYMWNGTSWVRSGTGGAPEWADPAGTRINYFWTANWRGATPNVATMFVTNFQVTNPNGAGEVTDDPIWYTQNGATWDAAENAAGFYFLPSPGNPPVPGPPRTGPFIVTARIIVSYKGRLVLLNTIENDNGGGGFGGGTNSWYPQRARFSHFGDPFADNAWYEPNQTDTNAPALTGIGDGGGFIDASTEEQIISAEFIKDRLIVFFERSTWELADTGNSLDPFRWYKINTELGSEATFSSIPFDRQILTMGTTGIHACNGANVERIDTKIPDQIFSITQKNLGVERVFGIRDYFTECVYWSFPSDQQLKTTPQFNNRILLYNYTNDSWAFNDDCITAFGYFEQQPDQTWASTTSTWQELEQVWASGENQAQFRQIIAGNQEGYVFLVLPDETRNAPVLQITNAVVASNPNIVTLTIVDHEINQDDWIAIENMTGVTGLIDEIFTVNKIIDEDTVQIDLSTGQLGGNVFGGSYLGGGTATRISVIEIQSKQWNPYVKDGRNLFLARIDFCVLKTASGRITVDYYASASGWSTLANSQAGVIMGNGVLETFAYDPAIYPFEIFQDRLWHPIYFQTTGEFIQINMYLASNQINNPDIAWSDFQLEGMVLHTTPTSARLQ